MIIITKYKPDKSGMGRVVRFLNENIDHKIDQIISPDIYYSKWDILLKTTTIIQLFHKIKSRRSYKTFDQKINKYLSDDFNLVLMHVQSLGFKFSLDIIEKRKQTSVFLCDNSFFCIRSYNFIENKGVCLKCLNDSNSFVKNNCTSFPVNDTYSYVYIKRLRELYSLGKVKILVQNNEQFTLAANFFKSAESIYKVGIMMADVFEMKSYILQKNRLKNNKIIYHGSNHDAKGINWFIDLAKQNPNYIFQIPCEVNAGLSNLIEQKMSWESGLKEECEKALLILVPSLWSAPIEGALIKSLIININVGIVQVDHAFSNEIATSCIFKFLYDNPNYNNNLLRKISDGEVSIDIESRRVWLNNFFKENESFHQNIKKVVGY